MVQFYTGNDERPGSTGLDLQFNRPNVKTRLKDGACQHIDWLAARHCDDFALKAVGYCVEINQCVGCTRQFFTKSFLGDGAAVLARSSGEESASPRHRAGVASMACR